MESAQSEFDHLLLERLSVFNSFRLGSNEASDVSLASLVSLVYRACGGIEKNAERVEHAWQSLYLAAHILDEIEDATRSSPNFASDDSAEINIATGLIARAWTGLSIGGDDLEMAIDLNSAFSSAVLTMCDGQFRDLTYSTPTLHDCWLIAEAKTGSFFGLGAYSGARIATSDPVRIECLQKFGFHLGMMVQIGDDYSGIWDPDQKSPDLHGKIGWTLPLAYAFMVAPETVKSRLKRRWDSVMDDPDIVEDLRMDIEETGAILYLKAYSRFHHTKAMAHLEAADSEDAAQSDLKSLVDGVSL